MIKENNYIVFAVEANSMMQDALIQQSNFVNRESAEKYAESLKNNSNLFNIIVLKKI